MGGITLGIDPGLTTGMAIAFINERNMLQYMTWTCNTKQQVWDFITDTIEQVCVEQFEAQLISKYGLHTVELVGGIEATCYIRGIKLTRQTPQQRYPYLEAASMLRTKGKGHTHHEKDALAHVLRNLNQRGLYRLW
jgi:hypothetical protein